MLFAKRSFEIPVILNERRAIEIAATSAKPAFAGYVPFHKAWGKAPWRISE